MIMSHAAAPAGARDAYRSNTYAPFSIVSVMSRMTPERRTGLSNGRLKLSQI